MAILDAWQYAHWQGNVAMYSASNLSRPVTHSCLSVMLNKFDTSYIGSDNFKAL